MSLVSWPWCKHHWTKRESLSPFNATQAACLERPVLLSLRLSLSVPLSPSLSLSLDLYLSAAVSEGARRIQMQLPYLWVVLIGRSNPSTPAHLLKSTAAWASSACRLLWYFDASKAFGDYWAVLWLPVCKALGLEFPAALQRHMAAVQKRPLKALFLARRRIVWFRKLVVKSILIHVLHLIYIYIYM